MDRYILQGHCPVECPDLMEWGRWMKTADRQVARTQVGDSDVSTVFLGIDHAFGNDSPVLFETMVFGGPMDGEQLRYRTWDDAEKWHSKIVDELRAPRALGATADGVLVPDEIIPPSKA